MSIEDINDNPNRIKMWLDNEKTAEETKGRKCDSNID